jgi:hypothetical protein
VTIIVLENSFSTKRKLYTFLCHREKSRNPPERSCNLYLCPTNSNSRLGITLPGHGKGGIEDDIRNPDRRGRHSETLTKEKKNIKESGRPKYGGHKKKGRYLDRKNSIQFHLK